jgi:hypothetical protein
VSVKLRLSSNNPALNHETREYVRVIELAGYEISYCREIGTNNYEFTVQNDRKVITKTAPSLYLAVKGLVADLGIKEAV